MRFRKPTQDIPACQWAWPRLRLHYGIAIYNTIQPIRIGRIVTASSSQTVTVQCCSMRCCIYRATTYRLNNSNASGNCIAKRLANAVGIALSEALLAREFNDEALKIVDHMTYVFAGDGCLMEGISHEACSLAGTLKLNKLVVFYDDNGVSIDGCVKSWFADDTPRRFEAYGWNVIRAVDGHNVNAVDAAIIEARRAQQPTLICCQTIIGKGAPHKEGRCDMHGAPLG